MTIVKNEAKEVVIWCEKMVRMMVKIEAKWWWNRGADDGENSEDWSEMMVRNDGEKWGRIMW